MSDLAGRNPRHLQQQHKLAKDLIRAARGGDADANSRLKRAFPGHSRYRLADAQLVIARDAGFESWAKLVRHVEQQELAAAGAALRHGDAIELRRLFAGSEFLRSQINAPHFDFGRRAIHCAAKDVALIDVLLEFGADPNAGSNWENGPFVPLDEATEASARHLISRGATLTANAAARLGWADELRAMLSENSELVHTRGGDGKTPLHEAATVAIADLLIDAGAHLDARCIDHRSTPAQYALVSRPQVCRRLLERGATADIFMAAHLGDAETARKILADEPNVAGARVNFPGYDLVPPKHIYCWELGWNKSARQVAIEAGHPGVVAVIDQYSAEKTRLLDAAWAGDEAAAQAIVAGAPDILAKLTSDDHKLLPHAAHLRNDPAALLMIDLGFDPTATGLDGGSTLHQAAWTGAAALVERLLKAGRCDLEQKDPTHGSTPLGWAAHGAKACQHKKGDYLKTVQLLVNAGARLDIPANNAGTTMIQQAEGNPAVQEMLRKLGAS